MKLGKNMTSSGCEIPTVTSSGRELKCLFLVLNCTCVYSTACVLSMIEFGTHKIYCYPNNVRKFGKNMTSSGCEILIVTSSGRELKCLFLVLICTHVHSPACVLSMTELSTYNIHCYPINVRNFARKESLYCYSRISVCTLILTEKILPIYRTMTSSGYNRTREIVKPTKPRTIERGRKQMQLSNSKGRITYMSCRELSTYILILLFSWHVHRTFVVVTRIIILNTNCSTPICLTWIELYITLYCRNRMVYITTVLIYILNLHGRGD